VPVSQDDDDEPAEGKPDRILEKALEVVKAEGMPAEKAAA